MKIVVAVDSPQCADTALNYLTGGRYGRNDEIHLVHAIVPGFADVAVPGIPDVAGSEKTSESKLLNEMAATLKEDLGVMPTIEISTGETAEVIASACKHWHADEAIVPSHARQGFSRLWFGSVADEIVDAAPCTVVVLKMAHV